jgi:hypothetical protein
MQTFSSLLRLILVVTAVTLSAAPSQAAIVGRSGGQPSNGIPTVQNVKNPACAPWFAVRDTIMGGLFGGQSCLSLKDSGSVTHTDTTMD